MKYRSVLFVASVIVGCAHAHVPLPAAPSVNNATVDRGEYLVRNVAVCGGCHSADPQNPDAALSGGREFRNWRIGVARASNLTSDRDTGLGAWSDAEIVRAIRNGVDREGHLLIPVMPFEWLDNLSDDDAFAIARYLKSQPPVRNDVESSPNLFFKMGRALFLHPEATESVADRGAYLARVALCADCHTQRTGLQQKSDRSRLFAGMENPPKEFPKRPTNLTPDNDTGIGRWSETDFITTIRTGRKLNGDSLHPFMPWQQIRRMSDDDLLAIYRYLRTLPPIHSAAAATQPKR